MEQPKKAWENPAETVQVFVSFRPHRDKQQSFWIEVRVQIVERTLSYSAQEKNCLSLYFIDPSYRTDKVCLCSIHKNICLMIGIGDTKMTTIKNIQKPHSFHTKNSVTRWNQIPELTDCDTLEDLLQTKLTITRVAEHLNCTRYQILHAMKAHGIDRVYLVPSDDLKQKLRI